MSGLSILQKRQGDTRERSLDVSLGNPVYDKVLLDDLLVLPDLG